MVGNPSIFFFFRMRFLLFVVLTFLILAECAPGKERKRKGRQGEAAAAEGEEAPPLPVWCSFSLPWRARSVVDAACKRLSEGTK